MIPQKQNPVLLELKRYNKLIILGCFAVGILYCLEIFFSPDKMIASVQTRYIVVVILGAGGLIFYNLYGLPKRAPQSFTEQQRHPNTWMGPPVEQQGPATPQMQLPQPQYHARNIWDQFDQRDLQKSQQQEVQPAPKKGYGSFSLSLIVFLLFVSLIFLWAFGLI